MTDETNRTDGPTPNRGRPREPETIDAAAVDATPVEATMADAAAEPAPRRHSPSLLAVAPGVAGLALAAYALFVAFEAAPGSDADAALGQRLEAIERRVGALESRPAPQAPDLAPLQTRLSALDARVAEALEQARARPEAPRVDLGPLEARLGALENRPQPRAFDPAPLETRLAQLDAAVKEMREALAAPKTDVRATTAPNVDTGPGGSSAAIALVADALTQKIARGAPFEREVAALENLGLPPDRLAALKPLAATGAPNPQALLQEFSQVSSAMLRAGRGPAPEGAGWLDRLSRSAASLVRVRPEGETAGEDAPALIGRIEAALRRNDAPAALALFERLPAAAQQPAREWEKHARAAAGAAAAARTLQDEAIGRLAQK